MIEKTSQSKLRFPKFLYNHLPLSLARSKKFIEIEISQKERVNHFNALKLHKSFFLIEIFINRSI